MIPIKQFKVDFTPSDNKQKEKQKSKVKGDIKKRSRPITGKVAAIVDDSKAKLQKMMKLNKSSIKDKVEVFDIDKAKTTKEIKIAKQQQQIENNKVTKFDTETFLKSQKQKQKQYAKQLNKQFQQSKKQRMNKLYQRQKEANEKIAQTKVQIKNKHKFYDQLPTLIRYPVQSSNQFILQTHHVTKIKQFISFIDTKQLRLDQEQSSNSKWQKTQKLCDDITKLKFVQLKDQQIKIRNQIIPYPQHDNLLSVLVMIAMKPQLLQKITLYDQKMVTQKVYPFLLYKNNKRFTVIIDNYLQIEQLQFQQVQKFSHCKNKNIMWISLFEKAYLKLFKKVGTLHEVTNNILNVTPQVIKISQNAIIKENLFDVLRFHLRNGGLLGAMRKGELKGSSAYEGRVYPIKQVRVGRVIQQSSLLVINPWHGKSLLSDGRQHISFKDLITQFNRLILIKDYSSSYVGSQLNINMYSFGIPASNNPEWVKNHQYLINVNKTSPFRIILKRTDQYPQIFGFSLVTCEPEDTKIIAINLDRLVVTVRSTLVNEASFAGTLQKGSYMILPFTHKKSQDSYVFLKLQIFTSNQANYTWGKSKIVDAQYKQIGKTQDKVQGDLQVIQKFEKPRAKPILQKGDKHLLPDLLEIKDIPNLASQNTLYKNDDIIIPGFAHRFITKQNIVVQEKPVTQKQKIVSVPVNPQTSYMNQNQQLKILLGIDAYTDDVDKQMMQQALSHLEQQIDLNNYQLGDEGFERVIEFMMQQPRITVINLKNNLLNDKSIVLLCYYLEKSNHTQIRKLDLSNNQIKAIGFNALQGLIKRIKNIKEIILTGNSGLKVQQIKSLSNL